ncbi:DUF6296 family protein [Streptomyces sp. NPDC002073]
MGDTAEGTPPDSGSSTPAPLLQHQGGTADDHGRAPGAPSRVGTGSTAPPVDPERVREANTREPVAGDLHSASPPPAPATDDPGAGPRQKYELVFPGGLDGGQDLVEVTITGRTGPGGHPVYEDVTGIIQAEISDQAEVRVLATGAGQEPAHGVTARPLN